MRYFEKKAGMGLHFPKNGVYYKTAFSVSCNASGGGIAQLVEQGTENPCVPSSILGPATIFLP